MRVTIDTREPWPFPFVSGTSSCQSVVFGVRADPLPEKTVAFELAYRAIMKANAGGPVLPAQFLEFQRRMKWVSDPDAIVLPRQATNLHRQSVVGGPKLRAAGAGKPHSSASSNIRSNGSQRPALKSAEARAFMASNFPAAAPAFICRSHSSSSKRWNSAMSSQYSRGESLEMASLISATLTFQQYQSFRCRSTREDVDKC